MRMRSSLLSFRCALLLGMGAATLLATACAQSAGGDVEGWIAPDNGDGGPVDPSDKEDSGASSLLQDAAVVHPDVKDDDEDSGTDASKDAGKDAAGDAATDAPTDAAVDAPKDAPADAPADTGTDAQLDAGVVDASDAGDAAVPDAGACTVVVNELMTGVTGGGTNEFVEVYNTCATPLAIGNWSIVYRAGTNDDPSLDFSKDNAILFTWPAATIIPANGLLVYGGTAYTGARDGTMTGGMKDGSGAVAVRNAAGTRVDSVGYGAGTILTGNKFIEGAATGANTIVAAPGNSIARHPNGRDTNNNLSDFTVGMATPKSAN